jgi:hypothetical protein
LKNHRTPDGVEIGAYMRALTRRLALDPGNGAIRATLRQAGLTQLDLKRKRAELDSVRTKLNRKRRERQLERDVLRLQKTAVGLERHLRSYAGEWTVRALESSANRALRRSSAETAR